MDKIIKITLGLFITILIATTAFGGYSWYVTSAYQSTLVSSYSYSCSITTDSVLTNVTLFLPVPADRTGNSPVVSQYSAGQISSLPESWKTTLFDTGKATLVKVSVPAIVPPEGTSPAHPYTLTIVTDVLSENVIDTANPVENAAVFRPVQHLQPVACDSSVIAKGKNPECSTFLTSLYADYEADANAAVTIKSSIIGTNRWSVSGEKSNEYSCAISLLMHGANHGWQIAKGTLENNIGSFEYPYHFT